jgi:hypothetical protein
MLTAYLVRIINHKYNLQTTTLHTKEGGSKTLEALILLHLGTEVKRTQQLNVSQYKEIFAAL